MFPIANTARFAATAAASLSVGKVLSEVIKNNIPDSASYLDTIQVKVGSAVLSYVIAGTAARRVEEFVDGVIENVAERQAQKNAVPTVTE